MHTLTEKRNRKAKLIKDEIIQAMADYDSDCPIMVATEIEDRLRWIYTAAVEDTVRAFKKDLARNTPDTEKATGIRMTKINETLIRIQNDGETYPGPSDQRNDGRI